MSRFRGLVLGLVVVAQAACVPVEPRSLGERVGLFETGTREEAQHALPFHVPQVSYVPEALRGPTVEYSKHAPNQWAVQRYEFGERVIFVKSERAPEGFRPARDGDVMIAGQLATLTARRGQDGGIIEWILYYRRGPVLHTVGGGLAADEVIRFAAGLR